MLLEDQQLGRYRLIQQIGSGGMGTIFLAEDTKMPRQVAMKVVRTGDDLPNSQEAAQHILRSFQREMRAIVQLDHPHILPVYDFGQETISGATYTYLVMLYRPEGSLSDWLGLPQNTTRLSLADIALLFTQAAQALHHAHTRGIVHQDVKPSNFLVRTDAAHPEALPDLLLADFGIARFSSATTTQSQNHNVRGTPMFMAPEQWDGRPVPASDQYALAIMAFRLLTARFPFQGTMGQIMHHHYMMQPPVPSSLNPQLNSTIDEVILRALAKEPGQRFPDTLAFADAFSRSIREPEDLQHVPIMLTATDSGSSASLSEHKLTASITSTAIKPGDGETLRRARSTANQPASRPTQTPPTPVPLDALTPTAPKGPTGRYATPNTSFLTGNDDATFITPTNPASISPGNDDPTFIKVAPTADASNSVKDVAVAPAFLLTTSAPQALAVRATSQQTGSTKRKYTPLQKGLVIALLALVVLVGSGLLLSKNLAAAKSAGNLGQNGSQAHTTITTSIIQTPAGTVTIVVVGTSTPTTGQTPNAPSTGSTSTSGTTPSATATATPGSGQQPTATPTATSAPKPTATPVPQPTATPAPRPTATTPQPPPGCSVSSWASNLRVQSNGGTVFHVTNYCQRTVSLRFTQKPTYTTDLQVCFGSNCSGWNSAPSSNVGTYIEFFSGVSVGAGFTINARCHGGATCPAAYTVHGDVKY